MHGWSNTEKNEQRSSTFVPSAANTTITRVTKSGCHTSEVAEHRGSEDYKEYGYSDRYEQFGLLVALISTSTGIHMGPLLKMLLVLTCI